MAGTHRPPTLSESVIEAKEEKGQYKRKAGGGNQVPGGKGPERQAWCRGCGHGQGAPHGL